MLSSDLHTLAVVLACLSKIHIHKYDDDDDDDDDDDKNNNDNNLMQILSLFTMDKISILWFAISQSRTLKSSGLFPSHRRNVFSQDLMFNLVTLESILMCNQAVLHLNS